MALAGELVRASDSRVVRGTVSGGVLATLGAQSGSLDVTHSAGFTPSQVMITGISPNGGTNIFTSADVTVKDATTFRVRCYGFNSTTGAAQIMANGTAVSFDWVVYP